MANTLVSNEIATRLARRGVQGRNLVLQIRQLIPRNRQRRVSFWLFFRRQFLHLPMRLHILFGQDWLASEPGFYSAKVELILKAKGHTCYIASSSCLRSRDSSAGDSGDEDGNESIIMHCGSLKIYIGFPFRVENRYVFFLRVSFAIEIEWSEWMVSSYLPGDVCLLFILSSTAARLASALW